MDAQLAILLIAPLSIIAIVISFFAGAYKEKSNAQARMQALQQQLATKEQEFAYAHAEANAKAQTLQMQYSNLMQQVQQSNDERLARKQENSEVIEAFAPIRANLEALQRRINAVEAARSSESGAVKQQLESLDGQQRDLIKATLSLSSVLANNKMRGAWGELSLKNLVETSGMVQHVDFDVQESSKNERDKTQRPDMIIHLPHKRCIVVDAKVPYNNYQKACEIPDNADAAALKQKETFLKNYATDVQKHIKTLGDKKYWKALEDSLGTSPEFVVMFIPNEALLRAALETDSNLLDTALAQRVVLSSPVAFWATIKAIAYTWEQYEASKNAQNILMLAKELYHALSLLVDRVVAMRTAVINCGKAYDGIVKTVEGTLLPKSRKLKDINPSEVFKPLETVGDDIAGIRTIKKAELLCAGKEKAAATLDDTTAETSLVDGNVHTDVNADAVALDNTDAR